MKIYKVKVNGKTYKVELEAIEEIKGKASSVETKTSAPKKEVKKASSTVGGQDVLAPIQGTVLDFKVKVGQKVKKGDVLLLIEAMKLENEVCSPCDGEIAEIVASKGQSVVAKQLLLKIK